jgi:hypothetical protein
MMTIQICLSIKKNNERKIKKKLNKFINIFEDFLMPNRGQNSPELDSNSQRYW